MIRTDARCTCLEVRRAGGRAAALLPRPLGAPPRRRCGEGAVAGAGQVDRIEPTVAKLAAQFPAWGHRKIWAMGRYDGWDLASPSSVHRAMARRGLLQPVRYQAERRQLAAARREVFVDPASADETGCDRWTSPSFETTTEGMWQLCGVVDYAAKVALACPVSATQTATDLLAAIDAALETLLGRCRDTRSWWTAPTPQPARLRRSWS